MVVGHQSLSTFDGWLHFVLDCKGETWSCQDACYILAPSCEKGWPSSPVQGSLSSLEPSLLPSLQGHGARRELPGMCFQGSDALWVCEKRASCF